MALVLFDPVRSAEPPTSSGSAGTMASIAFCEETRVASFGGSEASARFRSRTASPTAAGMAPQRAASEAARVAAGRLVSVAGDGPSGVDGDTGLVRGAGCPADGTVTVTASGAPLADWPTAITAKEAEGLRGALKLLQPAPDSVVRKRDEARAKVEKLGLKTYTQVIEGDGVKRTRVRVGPYASRDEADAAAAQVKRAGLPAFILAL